MGSTLDQEEIKRRIVAADSAFFLVSSTNALNRYKILWYSLGAPGSPRLRACKIDVLVPGVMCIPAISQKRFMMFKSGGKRLGVPPAMPILPLLLLKLQAWSDHRSSRYMDKILKQHIDARDIEELLEVCLGRLKERLKGVGALELPASFVDAGKRRIREFSLYYPNTQTQWNELERVFFV